MSLVLYDGRYQRPFRLGFLSFGAAIWERVLIAFELRFSHDCVDSAHGSFDLLRSGKCRYKPL